MKSKTQKSLFALVVASALLFPQVASAQPLNAASSQPAAFSLGGGEGEDSRPQWRPGKRLERRVADEVVKGLTPCANRDLLYRGHVDATYATREHGKLTVKIVDGGDVRDMSEVCVRLPQDAFEGGVAQGYRVGDEISRLVVPNLPQWRFLGNPGAIVWYAPLADLNGGPVWAGLGAFDGNHEWEVPSNIDESLVDLHLVKVETPSGRVLTPEDHGGEEQVNIFTSSGSRLNSHIISTNLGIWNYRAGVGSHAHVNWTFSAPGYWKLHWKSSLRVNGVYEESEVKTQIWAVGSNRDLMFKGQTPGTFPIQRPAEQIRAEMGLSAPEENGFDYAGAALKPQPVSYDPGSQCDALVPPVKPEVNTAPLGLKNPGNLSSVVGDRLSAWKFSSELPARQLSMHMFFNSGHYLTRTNLFNEQADADEVAVANGPVVDEEEPKTPHSNKGGSDKTISVDDSHLRVFAPGTFDSDRSLAESLPGNRAYVMDLEAVVPADPSGKVKGAELFLIGGGEAVDSAGIVIGELTRDAQTGVTKWTTLASTGEANRKVLQVKPGQKRQLLMLFTRPGLAQADFESKITYLEGQPAGVDPRTFHFVVGNQAINLYRQSKGNSELLPEGQEARVDEGVYAAYNANLKRYDEAQAACAAAEASAKKEEANVTDEPGVGQADPRAKTEQPAGEGSGTAAGEATGENPGESGAGAFEAGSTGEESGGQGEPEVPLVNTESEPSGAREELTPGATENETAPSETNPGAGAQPAGANLGTGNAAAGATPENGTAAAAGDPLDSVREAWAWIQAELKKLAEQQRLAEQQKVHAHLLDAQPGRTESGATSASGTSVSGEVAGRNFGAAANGPRRGTHRSTSVASAPAVGSASVSPAGTQAAATPAESGAVLGANAGAANPGENRVVSAPQAQAPVQAPMQGPAAPAAVPGASTQVSFQTKLAWVLVGVGASALVGGLMLFAYALGRRARR